MSVSSILNSNGKIPASLIEGGVDPTGTPTLAEVLNENNDANALFIDDCGGVVLTNGAGTPSKITLTSNPQPGGASSTQCLFVGDGLNILTDASCKNLWLGGTATDVKLSTQNGNDPAGVATEILNITDYNNGTAGINCASAFIGYLQVQSPDNRIYFEQNLNTGAVGATAGRIPIICGGTTYYLQVYASP
jgi:hypothetical protein